MVSTTWNAERIEDWLVKRVAARTDLQEHDIDPELPFNSLGMDSVDVMDIIVELDELLEIEIESTIVWDYPTIRLLSGYVSSLFTDIHPEK